MTIKFNKIPQNILDENNIIKFDGISEIFDFIYDEDWTKEEIIEQLTDDMKKQLVLKMKMYELMKKTIIMELIYIILKKI